MNSDFFIAVMDVGASKVESGSAASNLASGTKNHLKFSYVTATVFNKTFNSLFTM